ncbi:MAG TPA: hypothetical protein VGB78_04700, partial [Thermoplasmata archaeon]
MKDWTRSSLQIFTILLALFATAFVARMLSFQWSGLPYNIDGLSELRLAELIQDDGFLDLPAGTSVSDGYVSHMPILALFIAFLSSVTGLDPASSMQLIVSFIGALVVSVFFIVFRQHLPSSKAVLASALALALLGSFVFSTGCTWKETLGFLLLGLALFS